MAIKPGINLEFTRSEKITVYEGIQKAAAMGYKYVEPYVYSNISSKLNSHFTMQSVLNFCHINLDTDDTDRIKKEMADNDITFSAVNAHSSLLMSEGVSYLKRAIDFAREVECPYVMSDEGPIPEYIDNELGYKVMSLYLNEITEYAYENGVRYIMELHNSLTTNEKYLVKLLEDFPPEKLSVNFDTGNVFLGGNDPAKMLENVIRRVVHIHAKDIPASMLSLRGKVTGTRVGVALGEGEIDFDEIFRVLKRHKFDGVMSIECDTLEEGRRSLEAFKRLDTQI